MVAEAAAAGVLPARLDADGIHRALRELLCRNAAGAAWGALEPRYYKLAEIVNGRLRPGVQQRVAEAAAAGVPGVRSWGDFDPAGFADKDGRVALGGGLGTDWWARVAAAGPRPDCILPDPYEGRSGTDGSVPLDRAMSQRDATGDVWAYADELERIGHREPRDVDAWAHLGNHYLNLAEAADGMRSPGGPAVGERTVRGWLEKALGFYQVGVSVAELALPDPFGGFLFRGHLDNRPFFRAIHGAAYCLWALGRFDEAEHVLLNMLWLTPGDDPGASDLLPIVRARTLWGHAAEGQPRRRGTAGTHPRPAASGGSPDTAPHAAAEFPEDGPDISPGRIVAWAAARRSPARREAIAAITSRLLLPPLLPEHGADGPLPLWQWLLDQLGEGIPLTQTGNLNRAFVQANAERFGWDFTHRRPYTEQDVTDLHELRTLATGLGLVRQAGRKLALTAEGRRLAADPAALWQATARALVSEGDDFEAYTGEVFLALLLHRETLSRDEIAGLIVRAAAEEGFRGIHDGNPPDEDDTMWTAHRTINRFHALGLLAGKWTDRSYRFTAVGTATALETLRARAGLPAGRVALQLARRVVDGDRARRAGRSLGGSALAVPTRSGGNRQARLPKSLRRELRPAAALVQRRLARFRMCPHSGHPGPNAAAGNKAQVAGGHVGEHEQIAVSEASVGRIQSSSM